MSRLNTYSSISDDGDVSDSKQLDGRHCRDKDGTKLKLIA